MPWRVKVGAARPVGACGSEAGDGRWLLAVLADYGPISVAGLASLVGASPQTVRVLANG